MGLTFSVLLNALALSGAKRASLLFHASPQDTGTLAFMIGQSLAALLLMWLSIVKIDLLSIPIFK